MEAYECFLLSVMIFVSFDFRGFPRAEVQIGPISWGLIRVLRLDCFLFCFFIFALIALDNWDKLS